MAVDLAQVIPPLVRAKLDFILIGGFGIRFKCIDLPTLIRIKEAAGRRKDLEAIVLLEEIDEKQT
jgi:hypothetical protein